MKIIELNKNIENNKIIKELNKSKGENINLKKELKNIS